MKTFWNSSTLHLATFLFASGLFAQSPVELGSYWQFSESSATCVEQDLYEFMQERAKERREELREIGAIPSVFAADDVLFRWPVIPSADFPGKTIYAVSRFMDHDEMVNDNVLDYNCGDRTYDLSTGYNHTGTDIALNPFPWNSMAEGYGVAVAAADGFISFKMDGNPDMNCQQGDFDSNSIHVQHADGSITKYAHLKKNSLTAKLEGESVQEGEPLGLVGSSGSSEGPHLHFEVEDAEGNIIDPFGGPCNLGSEGRWKEQKPYFDSGINQIITHVKTPQDFDCPAPSYLFDQNQFEVGDSLVIGFYFRHMVAGVDASLRFYFPNGELFQEKTVGTTNDHFENAWYYWIWTLPAGTTEGVYLVEGSYNGEVESHLFTFGNDPYMGLEGTNELPLIMKTLAEGRQYELVADRQLDFGLFSSSGQSLRQWTGVIGSNPLNLKALSAGIYFLNARDEKGQERSFRLLKQ